MKKIYTNTMKVTMVLIFLLAICCMQGIAQTKQSKTEERDRHGSGTKAGIEKDAGESGNRTVAFLWQNKANDPDLTFKQIAIYCDSLFAIPGNMDTGEDGEYKNYISWKFFWCSRIDAKTGKLHDFNKAAAAKLYKNPLGSSGQNLAVIGSTGETDCEGQSQLQAGIQNLSYGGTDGYGWGFIGPQNVPPNPTWVNNYAKHYLGRVTGTRVNPTDHTEIYVSDEFGGLWRTKNSGNTWTCLTDNEQTISGIGIGHFDVDFTSSPRKIYASVGYPGFFTSAKFAYLFDDTRTYGLFFSTDDGKDWHFMDCIDMALNLNWTIGEEVINDIKINPGNANYVFFTTKYQLARVNVSTLNTDPAYPLNYCPGVTSIMDYSQFLPCPLNSGRSEGFGQIAFLPSSPTNDMFVTVNSIYGNAFLHSAQLFYVPNCTASTPGVPVDITANLNGSLVNSITNSTFSCPGCCTTCSSTCATCTPQSWWNENWQWSNSSGDHMEFTDRLSTGSGCLETSVEGNYTSPVYNYNISFDVQIPNNTSLNVFLRDPTNPYSIDCAGPGLGPDIPVWASSGTTSGVIHISVTVPTSSSSCSVDNYITRLIFKATALSGYNASVDGPITVANVTCNQVYWDFMSIGTTPASGSGSAIYAMPGRIDYTSSTISAIYSVQKSTNNGASWTSLGTITIPTNVPPISSWCVSPTNSNLIYWGTPDGGSLNINQFNSGSSTPWGSLWHCDPRIILALPTGNTTEDVYVGEDGGLSGYVAGNWVDMTSGNYPATPDQTTPKDINQKIEIYSCSLPYSIGTSIHTGDVVMGAVDDNILHANLSNYTKWDNEQGGDCYYAQYGKRPQTNSTYYFNSNGGGGTFYLSSNIGSASLSTYAQPYHRIKTTTDAEYFAGGDKYLSSTTIAPFHSYADIFKLNSSGTTWQNITNAILNPTVNNWPGNGFGTPPVTDNYIWSFSPDAFDPNFLVAFLGRTSDFWSSIGDFAITNDGGANWTVLPNTFPNNRNYLDIAVDPRPYQGNPNLKRFWAGAAWYETTAGANRVFQFIYDKGTGTWSTIPTDYSTGLPDGPVNALVYDEQSRYLFAGTDVGVYARSVDDPSSTWVCFSMNLPNSFVTNLEINRCTGKIYVSLHGRGAYEAELPAPNILYDWDDPAQAPYMTMDITASTTWGSDMDITRSVIVEPGVTLTINNGAHINMGRDKNITVKAGGILIVDHATITNSCGTLWGCISVEGDGNTQNLSSLTQGQVTMTYGTIANAYAGVFIGGQLYDGSDSPDYDFDPSHDGGYVSADHTTFHNCVTGAWILPFANKQNSKFTNCTFEATDFLNSHHYTDFNAGATNPRRYGSVRGIWFGNWASTSTVGGVTIDNCTFQTVNGTSAITGGSFNPAPDLRGTGIVSSNASYKVTNCNFINLTRGIQAANDASNAWWSAPYVDGNTFTNNWRAASFMDVNNVVFQNNTITVGGPCTYPTTSTSFNLDPVGAYFSQAQGLWIYKNNISMAGPSSWSSGHKTYGIILNNTNNNTYAETSNPYLSVLSNTFYKNTIATDIGICAYQDNKQTQFQCNNLQGCAYRSLSVWGSSTIQGLIDNQGSSSAPAGNEFPNPSPSGCSSTYFDLASGSMDPVSAFVYNEFNTPQFIASCLSSTSIFGFTSIATPNLVTSATCATFGTSCCADLTTLPSYYCPLPKMAHEDYLQTISQIEHAIDSMQNNIDGGNLSALFSSLSSSSLSSGQLKNNLMSSQYLSDKVLISAIDRVPAMDDIDLKQIVLKNSGLNKNVWNELNLKHASLTADVDILNAQSTLSGRNDLEASMRDALKARNEALKDLTNAYVHNEDWNSAAQLYASKQAWEIAIGFYLKAGDMNNASAMVQNIQDPSENKLLTLFINHIAHRYTGAMPDKNTVDSLSTQEQQSLKELASNPYTHAGELARVWLNKSKGHNILELMPAGDGVQGAAANAENNNEQLAQLNNSNALVKVFPNPAQNMVRVELRKGTWGNAAVINCYDMNSKQMAKIVPDANSNIADINTTTWLSGVYMIIVQLSNGDETIQKLIIEKP